MNREKILNSLSQIEEIANGQLQDLKEDSLPQLQLGERMRSILGSVQLIRNQLGPA